MIKIMKGCNKFHTPQGLAIMGTYPNVDINSPEEKVKEMYENLKDLKFVYYQSKLGDFRKIKVKSMELANTLVGGLNIGLLIDDIDFIEDLKPEIDIYRQD